MSTRQLKAIYWVTTVIVCAVAAFSAVNFWLAHPIGPSAYRAGGAFAHLGLPPFRGRPKQPALASAFLLLLVIAWIVG